MKHVKDVLWVLAVTAVFWSSAFVIAWVLHVTVLADPSVHCTHQLSNKAQERRPKTLKEGDLVTHRLHGWDGILVWPTEDERVWRVCVSYGFFGSGDYVDSALVEWERIE